MNREKVIEEVCLYGSMAGWEPLANWHIARMKERTEKCAEVAMIWYHHELSDMNGSRLKRAILALNGDEPKWCEHCEIVHGDNKTTLKVRLPDRTILILFPDDVSFCPVCGKERPKE